MYKIVTVSIILFLILFSSFATQVGKVSAPWDFLPEIVAEIDGKKITRADFIKNVVVTKLNLATASRDQLESLAKITLKQQVEKYIITRLMQHDGITPSAELVLQEYQKIFSELSAADQIVYLRKIGRAKVQLLEHWQQLCNNPAEQFRVAFTLWLKNKIALAVVTDKDIEACYREHQDKFRQPESVSIRSLMVNFIRKNERQAAREKTEDIIALVRQGVDFNKQAEKYRVPNNTLNGTFIHGGLPKNIEKIVFSMNNGQISNIIVMPAGFVIIKVDKKTPAGYIPLSKVKFGLKLELKRDKATRWFRKAMIKERAKITVKSFLIQ